MNCHYGNRKIKIFVWVESISYQLHKTLFKSPLKGGTEKEEQTENKKNDLPETKILLNKAVEGRSSIITELRSIRGMLEERKSESEIGAGRSGQKFRTNV